MKPELTMYVLGPDAGQGNVSNPNYAKMHIYWS